MATISLRPRAYRDLNDLWATIAAYADDATADQFVQQIYRRLDTLAAYPLSGRERSDLRPGLRSSAVGRYLICYDPLDDGILVSRILYGGRDLPGVYAGESDDDPA